MGMGGGHQVQFYGNDVNGKHFSISSSMEILFNLLTC